MVLSFIYLWSSSYFHMFLSELFICSLFIFVFPKYFIIIFIDYISLFCLNEYLIPVKDVFMSWHACTTVYSV